MSNFGVSGNRGWPVSNHGAIKTDQLITSPDGPFVHAEVALRLEEALANAIRCKESLPVEPSETIVRASQARELLWEALAALKNNDTTAAIKAITKAIAILSFL